MQFSDRIASLWSLHKDMFVSSRKPWLYFEQSMTSNIELTEVVRVGRGDEKGSSVEIGDPAFPPQSKKPISFASMPETRDSAKSARSRSIARATCKACTDRECRIDLSEKQLQ